MAGNLLNIGKTGLFAAQAGLATTGHNISNAHVVGYSRQVVVQSTMIPQDYGYGFVGNGTQVADIKRYSDEFLNVQVRNAQSTSSALNAYATQINQVDNLLADPTSGLSPALQDFFKAVQDVSSNPAEIASRQALLANGEALAARFQGMNGRLEELRQGVNSQIVSNVTVINSYAQQIASLNDQISAATTGTGSQPNDLLDARDQLVLDLNKQIKATVVRGDNNSINGVDRQRPAAGDGQPQLRAGGDGVADRPAAPGSRLCHRHQGVALAGKRDQRRRTGRPDGVPLRHPRPGPEMRWGASPSPWPRPSMPSTGWARMPPA